LPEGEENRGMVDLSSLAIRIPHVCQGVAEEVLPQLFREGRLESALILSPPGGGKTTLLRDLARLLGDGTGDVPSMRLALVDERGELAAMHHGVPQLPVGRRTDVLDGCPKALAVPMLLRAMNPQVIALDELALPSDVEAVTAAAGCGAVLLATVHAASVEELKRRSIGPALLEVFHQAVIVSVRDGKRCYRVEEL
jgi:stage III sporulation protein AA